MNDFDIAVMRKIQESHRLHGKYPTQFVVPDNYVKYMSCRTFFFQEPANILTIAMADTASTSAIPRTYDRIQVDIVSESEFAAEKRQRERVHSSLNLKDC